ncbi:MAG: ParA family protein [Treponemataceae bacterium]|nr:ParA family protein [Treponemataceae bacterium]
MQAALFIFPVNLKVRREGIGSLGGRILPPGFVKGSIMVITFPGMKGGVGKSTDAILLANNLAARGFKVLFFDMDTNNSSTIYYTPGMTDEFPDAERRGGADPQDDGGLCRKVEDSERGHRAAVAEAVRHPPWRLPRAEKDPAGRQVWFRRHRHRADIRQPRDERAPRGGLHIHPRPARPPQPHRLALPPRAPL